MNLPELRQRWSRPGEEPDPKENLVHWVIYDHPADYPRYWVVRRQWNAGSKELVVDRYGYCRHTLKDARQVVPEGLVRMERMPGDETVIAETWI